VRFSELFAIIVAEGSMDSIIVFAVQRSHDCMENYNSLEHGASSTKSFKTDRGTTESQTASKNGCCRSVVDMHFHIFRWSFPAAEQLSVVTDSF